MEEIRRILDSDNGKALKDYLLNQLEELKNIDNLNEKDIGSHQVIEVKAQKRAYAKLKEILQVIMTFSEPAKVKDKRDSYNVE